MTRTVNAAANARDVANADVNASADADATAKKEAAPDKENDMAEFIARTLKEVQDVRDQAQKLTFRAEDNGDTDETASAVYDVLQWLLGNSDTDPREGVLEDDEDE
jgi:hypothetical protein